VRWTRRDAPYLALQTRTSVFSGYLDQLVLRRYHALGQDIRRQRLCPSFVMGSRLQEQPSNACQERVNVPFMFLHRSAGSCAQRCLL